MLLVLCGVGLCVFGLMAQTTPPAKLAVSRHALTNNGRIEGSAQQLLGEGFNLNSGAYFGGDLQVPGSPNVNVNGQPAWKGQSSGGGATTPTGYTITVNSGVTMGYLVGRTNPITLDAVSTPPSPSGTRQITINSQSDVNAVGSWSTVKDLTLNSGAPDVAVPPGTYGTFMASNNAQNGFVLGVSGSSTPSAYNLQSLTLNSSSRIKCAGPVVLTVAGNVVLNANSLVMGSSANSSWLRLQLPSSGLNLNSTGVIYGDVRAPNGVVQINGVVYGSVQADSLTVNSGGVIKNGVVASPTPTPSPTATPFPTVVGVQSDMQIRLAGQSAYIGAHIYDAHGSQQTAEGTTSRGVACVYHLKVANDGNTRQTFTVTGGGDNANWGHRYFDALSGGSDITASITGAGRDVTLDPGAFVEWRLEVTPDATSNANGLDQTMVKSAVRQSNGNGNGNGAGVDLVKATTRLGAPQPTPAPVYQADSSLRLQSETSFVGSGVFETTPQTQVKTQTVSRGSTASFVFQLVNAGNRSDSLVLVGPASGNGWTNRVYSLDGTGAATEITTLATGTGWTTPALAPGGSVLVRLDILAGGTAPSTAQLWNTYSRTGTPAGAAATGWVGVDAARCTVNATDAPPVAQNSTLSFPQDTPQTLTLAATPSNGQTLTYSVVTQPAHGTLSVITGNKVVYTPTALYFGSDSFTWKANDGTNDSNVATYSLSITHVNHAPVAKDDAYTVAEDGTLNTPKPGVLANDTDLDSDPLSAQLVAGPSHGTVTLSADGSFVYTPTALFFGSDSFTYKDSDGQAFSNTATVALTVTHVNHPPVAKDDAYTTSEDVPLSVQTGGVLFNDTDADGDPLTAKVATPPTHGTLTLNANGTFLYTPASLFYGQDAFTYTASDGQGGSATATATIAVAHVNHAPVATSSQTTLLEDGSVALSLPASDVDNDALSYSVITQPSHGTLSAIAGNGLTYTPTALYFGSDSFTWKANDGQLDSNTATLSLTVTHVNHAPIAKDDAYTVLEDGTLTTPKPGVLANDTDADGDALTAQLVSNPTHGTLTLNADGSFVYTPTALYFGSDSFTYKAFDGQAVSNTATVSLSVTHVNHKPVATNQSLDLNEDGSLALTLMATDADGDPLTYAVTAQPANGTLSGTAPNLVYTPNALYFGSDSLTFTANDGQATSNTATVAFSVHHINHKPVGTVDLYQIDENMGLSQDAVHGVLSNDFDADNDALSAILVSNPTHGTLSLDATGSFLYTPGHNFYGTDSFTYSPKDNGTPAPLTGDAVVVTIVVNHVNQPPVAYNGTVTTNQDAAVSGGLGGDDVDDATNTLTFALVSPPSAGSVSVNADGTFSYTPGAKNSGLDTFTFGVTDPHGAVSNTATESVQINRSTNPPIAVDDSYSVVQDTPLSGATVLANDQNPASFKMSAVLDGTTTHGALTLNAGGTFVYTPGAGYVGDDAFTYHIQDARGALSNTATATIHVTHINHAPVAVADAYTTSEDVPLNVSAQSGVLANDSDPDGTAYGDALHVALVAGSGPAQGTLALNADGSFVYTPRLLHSTVDSSDGFDYIVSDGRGGSATAHVSLTISAVNHPPVAVSQSLSSPQDSSASFALSASDPDNEAFGFELSSLPSHGTLGLQSVQGPLGVGPIASGKLIYMPTAGYRGADSFGFVARDARGLSSNPATVSIQVLPINHAPKALDDAYTTSEDAPLTISAPGVLSNDSDPDGDALTVTGVDATNAIGGVTWKADGSFVYTPALHWFGVDGFDYTVSDGKGGSATAHVGIGVARVAYAPIAVDDVATSDGSNISIPVLLNDSNPNGDAFKVVSVTQGAHGAAISPASDGQSVLYKPGVFYVGDDSFSYTIANTSGLTASAKVVVHISAAPPFSGACPNDFLHARKVLVLNGGDDNGEYGNLIERLAGASGNTVTSVNETQWRQMTTAQFASYDAILLTEYAGLGDSNAANQTKAIWSPAITGNIVVSGMDPGEDTNSGDPNSFVTKICKNAFDFAASGPGTGLVVMYGDDYYAHAGGVLSLLGNFDGRTGGNGSGQVHSVYPGHLIAKDIPTTPFNTGGYAYSLITSYPSDFKPVYSYSDGSMYMLATDCKRVQPTPTPSPTPSGPDTVKPLVSIQYPGDGDFVNGLDFVTGQASDDRQLASVVLSVQRQSDGLFWTGSGWGAASSSTSLATSQSGASWSRFQSQTQPMPSGAQIASGSYILTATATDAAGNAASAVATVRVDTQAPQVAITSPVDGVAFQALSSVSGTASDDSGAGTYGVKVWLQRASDGAYWAPGTGWVGNFYGGVPQVATLDTAHGTWTQGAGWPAGADLSFGDYTLFAQATDIVGHTAQTQNGFHLTAATPAPTPTPTVTVAPTPTPTLAPALPDGIVTSPDGTSVGDSLYNADGAGQIGISHVAPGASAQYTLTLRNNSPDPDGLILVGPASRNGWTLTYYDQSGIDITSFVTGASGWLTPNLQNYGSVDVTLQMTAPASGSGSLTALARLYSSRGDAFDTFGAQTLVDPALPTPTPTPLAGGVDASIRATTGGDTGDKGVGVVNADATNQTAQESAVAGTGGAAAYVLTLRSTTPTPDALVVVGPAHESGGSSHWTLRYFDAPTGGNDISAQVTGAGGWTTPQPVASGSPVQLRVEVSPDAGLSGGSTFSALFGIQSGRDATARDVVGALTANSFFPTPTPTVTPTATATPIATASPTPTVDPTKDDAKWVAQTVPATMIAGHLYRVSETFGNTGGTTWNLDGLSGTYALGSEEPTDNVTWGVKRVAAGNASCAPGAGVQLTWTLTAPSTPGTYAFAWRMNNSATGKGRFGQESQIVQVSVSADPSITPTPTASPTPTQPPTLIANGSFEMPVVGAGNFQPTPPGSQWTWGTIFAPHTLACGIAGNGSSAIAGLPKAPEGVQVGIFEDGDTASQSVYFDGGTYTVSLKVAAPAGYINAYVGVDGYNFYHMGSPGALSSFTLYTTPRFTVPAGFHTIRIQSDDNSDSYTSPFAVDDVRLVKDTSGAPAPTPLPIVTPVPTPTPTVAPTPTPAPAKVDALVLAPGDTGFAGDNYYTPTGDGVQSIAAPVPADTGASVGVAVENDGAVPANMRFFGPASSGGWLLHYMAVSTDASGSVVTRDVTSLVTGAGFVTQTALRGPSAGTGGARDVAQINVVVSSEAAVAIGAAQKFLVHWEEDGNPLDLDAVTINATKTAGTSITPAPTLTPTPTASATPTPVPTVTATPTRTPRPTPTPTPSATPTPTALPRLKANAPAIHPDGGAQTGSVALVTIDDVQEPQVTLVYTLDGSDPSLDSASSHHYTSGFYLTGSGTTAPVTVKARAYAVGKDASDITTNTYTFTPDGVSGAPGVAIEKPSDGTQVSAPTDVIGLVSAPNLAYWQLSLKLLDGDAQEKTIAQGTGVEAAHSKLGVLDPTLLLNGLYRLHLSATTKNGESSDDVQDVWIRGGLKIGQFSLSFNDLTLPVAGMPISLTRTYDSRDQRKGEFGIGWSLSSNDVRLQSNGPVGGVETGDAKYYWQIVKSAGGFYGPNYNLVNTKKRLVSITLPDGKVYAFQAATNPSQWSAVQGAPTQLQVLWQAQSGTHASLKSTDQTGEVTLSDTGGPVWLQDANSDVQALYDPHEWELTLPSGGVFHFHVDGDISHGGKARLDSIKDLSGNTLTFVHAGDGTLSGLQSSDATGHVSRSVSLHHDSQGFVDAITDPDGASLLYSRDTLNNLVRVTDRVGNPTTMGYGASGFPHYLTTIVDARGVRAERSDYDGNGRLVQVTDASGQVTTLDHSHMSASQEVVKDRRGTRTQLDYDGYGNVIASHKELKDAAGQFIRWITSSSTYGDPDNPDMATRMVDPLGRVSLMHYTPNGVPDVMTRVMDNSDSSKNRTTTTSYNQYNNPLSVTDALGHIVVTNTYWNSRQFWQPVGSDASQITRQPEGALATSTDANGITTFYGYNKQSRPWQTITGYGTPQAQTTTYSYDYNTGNLVGVSDTNGHGTGFVYDSNGQKVGQSTSRTLYGVDGSNAGTQTMATSMVLDADGRVVKTLLPDGATTQTHYNAISKVDYTVDALRRVTSYHYNTLGQRDATTYADGTGSSTSYDENEEAVGGVDRSGRGSQSTYDTLGRVTNSLSLGTSGQVFKHADGSVIQSQTQYDDAGQAGASIDELGHISRTQYDAAGEALSSTVYDDDGTGSANVARTSTTVYDADGRAVQSTDALGRYSIPTYDNGGRVTQSTLFDRGGVAINTSSTHYDSLGRVDYATDASGHQKRMIYDALGRLSAVIQATQGVPTSDGGGAYDLVTRFQYDEVGHKIAQQDANGRITRFGYDVRGRMIWRALPMDQVEGMSYDAGGQLQTSTDFRGYVTTCSYDLRGRLLAKVPDARLREATLTYAYPDENTRFAYRGAAVTKQSYDKERGWLNSVTGPNGTISYSYNSEGQKLAMTAPSGTTGYAYDVMGRLSLINDQPSGATAPTNIAAYAYDAVGNLASLTRGNGVVTRYAYDEQNRLSDLVNTSGAGDLSRFHYALRGDGKRTGIDESVVDAPDATTGAQRSSARSLAYSYDNAGKLTSETGQDGLGVAYANTWSYDAVGNRTSATVQKAATAGATTWAHTTSVSAVFNANDQLTSQSSSVDGGAAAIQNFSYDANGAEAGTSNASGTSSNGWDFEGKLTQTALSDTNGNAAGGSSNSFDAAGDRLAHTDDVGKTGQKTISYLVDTDTSYAQVIEERAPDTNDAAGTPALQARYVWGGGLSPLAMWRKAKNGSVKLFFHLSDGQESVRQLTDASGAVVDSYFYDAWGNTLDGSSNHVANPFKYTGQQLDADGKYYLRARFYNPGTGRFLSHDPLIGSDGDPVSMHRYLYAGADGVNACDPSGRDSSYGEELSADTIATEENAMGDEVVKDAGEEGEKTLFEWVATHQQILARALLVVQIPVIAFPLYVGLTTPSGGGNSSVGGSGSSGGVGSGGNDEVLLVHGTTRKRAELIKKNGPHNTGGEEIDEAEFADFSMAYANTKGIKYASEYALLKSQGNEGEGGPALLFVRVPRWLIAKSVRLHRGLESDEVVFDDRGGDHGLDDLKKTWDFLDSHVETISSAQTGESPPGSSGGTFEIDPESEWEF